MRAILAAVSDNNVIGRANTLPWHLPEDLKNFKRLTKGNTVIMGRKTFESILDFLGKPLPKRNNIVISRTMDERDDVDVCRSIEEAIGKAEGYGTDIFFIGGEGIFKAALDIVDRLYISHVHQTIEDGDAFFPDVDWEEWGEIENEEFDGFTYRVYERR